MVAWSFAWSLPSPSLRSEHHADDGCPSSYGWNGLRSQDGWSMLECRRQRHQAPQVQSTDLRRRPSAEASPQPSTATNFELQPRSKDPTSGECTF